MIKEDKAKKYKERDEVDLVIMAKTDLGYKAIIDGGPEGLLYLDEVFRELRYGQQLKGFIKKVREDGKIDLSLNEIGRKASYDIAMQMMDLLQQSKGFLAVNDKTSAEKIYELFGVSKKKFKIALGGLYKKRLIEIKDDGIYLVSQPATAKQSGKSK
jgi:predicted RNA-binding protein (virulence factor B family)